LFGLVTFYLRSTQAAEEESELSQLFLVLVPLVAVAGIAASFQVFKLMVKKAREHPDLKSKVSRYGSALIVRYALLEAPSLLGIIAFFLTDNYLFLAISGLIVALFFVIRPTKAKLEQDLELTPTEIAYLDDPNAIITERSYTR